MPLTRIKSLTRFLIISITLSIIIIDGVTVLWSYYTIHSNTSRFFDVILIESAEKLKVFMRAGELTEKNLKNIQFEINESCKDGKCVIDPVINKNKYLLPAQSKWTTKFTQRYRTESVFQVWKIEPERLLIHSKFAPSEDFAEFIPGYQTVEYKNYQWRVYTQVDSLHNIVIQTAQREDLRSDLSGMIISEHLYPIAILMPVLMLLIFLAIKFTADSMKHIANAIKRRDPRNLNSINITNIPAEIKPLTEELNRLFDLINQNFEREQRFNSDAAHELKTPLAAIKSQAEVAIRAIEQKDTTQLKKNLQQIVKGIDRANHLVSQLLLLSRLSPDMTIEQIEPCYLDKITRGIIADSINAAIDKKIEITQDVIFNTGSNVVPAIMGSKILLGALARNIIDNAIRYSGHNSNISVEIIVNFTNIMLKVTDTGPGLSDELKQRIFDRFFREPGTNTEGSGLGLSIVNLIANLHNAEIQLSDNIKDGHGLVFTVVFRQRVKKPS